MGKVRNVVSRFKDPDKIIEKLKAQLLEQSNELNYWMKEYHKLLSENEQIKENHFGEFWFSYNKEATHSVRFINNPLDKSKEANVGDKVVITGEIIEVTQSVRKKSASALFHTQAVYLNRNKNET